MDFTCILADVRVLLDNDQLLKEGASRYVYTQMHVFTFLIAKCFERVDIASSKPRAIEKKS